MKRKKKDDLKLFEKKFVFLYIKNKKLNKNSFNSTYVMFANHTCIIR